MATIKKKSVKKSKVKPPRATLKKSTPKKPAQTVQSLQRELADALEQQAATSEILSVISSSPTDVQPVFDTIVKNATRLCEGTGCSLVRFDGELLHLVAQHNVSAEVRDFMQRLFPRQPTRESAMERAILDSTVTHVPDVFSDAEHRRDITCCR